jgi:hypothetical protein
MYCVIITLHVSAYKYECACKLHIHEWRILTHISKYCYTVHVHTHTHTHTTHMHFYTYIGHTHCKKTSKLVYIYIFAYK